MRYLVNVINNNFTQNIMFQKYRNTELYNGTFPPDLSTKFQIDLEIN